MKFVTTYFNCNCEHVPYDMPSVQLAAPATNETHCMAIGSTTRSFCIVRMTVIVLVVVSLSGGYVAELNTGLNQLTGCGGDCYRYEVHVCCQLDGG